MCRIDAQRSISSTGSRESFVIFHKYGNHQPPYLFFPPPQRVEVDLVNPRRYRYWHACSDDQNEKEKGLEREREREGGRTEDSGGGITRIRAAGGGAEEAEEEEEIGKPAVFNRYRSAA